MSSSVSELMHLLSDPNVFKEQNDEYYGSNQLPFYSTRLRERLDQIVDFEKLDFGWIMKTGLRIKFGWCCLDRRPLPRT
jgi:hypothetical protein